MMLYGSNSILVLLEAVFFNLVFLPRETFQQVTVARRDFTRCNMETQNLELFFLAGTFTKSNVQQGSAEKDECQSSVTCKYLPIERDNVLDEGGVEIVVCHRVTTRQRRSNSPVV